LAKDENMLKRPIILDEVQKVPQILDDVHWLIENKSLRFILCGSSVRKLKRGKANLLGGRAWRYEMHPLVSVELKELDLLRILNRGLIAGHYLSKDYVKSLAAYTQDYLKEEIFSEDYSPRLSIIVCNEREERLSGNIRILPWKEFLKQLWNGKIIS
jgi:predicted AAA+ superfamily ATPase